MRMSRPQAKREVMRCKAEKYGGADLQGLHAFVDRGSTGRTTQATEVDSSSAAAIRNSIAAVFRESCDHGRSGPAL